MPTAEPKAQRFLCKRCNRRIRIPEGWSFGPAVRKHYWAKHPEIMQPRQKLGEQPQPQRQRQPQRHGRGKQAGT